MNLTKRYKLALQMPIAGLMAGTMGIATYPSVAQAESSLLPASVPGAPTASSSMEWSGSLPTVSTDNSHFIAEALSVPSQSSGMAETSTIVEWSNSAPSNPSVGTGQTGASPTESGPATPSLESPAPVPVNAGFLAPTSGTVLDVPAATVILQFPVGRPIDLLVNGTAVDAELIGRTETDSSTNLVTQTWYGVPLQEGENTLTIREQETSESLASTVIMVRGAVEQLSVESVEARIPADGRSTATIRGQLIDENGNRSNRDAVITLEASSGEFVGADYHTDRPGFQVQARQGQFTATLQSSLNAGPVRIRATDNNLEAFTQLEFATALRSNLITGVLDLRLGARGTDYFGSFRDFLPADEENQTQLDVDGAVFATGSIGEWLFTGAYNSDRPLNEGCDGSNSLFRQQQSCDRNYPVYGDDSTSDILAPSTDQVYFRLERTSPVDGAGPDYFMWGDYNTEELATRSQLFTSTTRELHGAKVNYNFGDLRFTAFYANNVEGFQRDTLAPDGTSGYYFLSRRLLVPGSEDVFIELEELNRPGTVLERQQLNRGADYDIDYDRGTLLFREPILRTDVDSQGRTLVRRIVATYQYDSNVNTNIYGGRVQYNLSRELNRESWLGATYFHQNQGNRNFELYGADALISFGNDGELIAEYAHSSNTSDLSGSVSGEAYRVEVRGTLLDGLLGRAYWNHTDPGFANDATTSFVPGQTRYGAELQYHMSDDTSLRVQYDHEDNFGTAPRPLDAFDDLINPGSQAAPGSRVDNSLTTITAGIQQQIGDATLDVNWIHRDRRDRMSTEHPRTTSDQLQSRLTVPIADHLTFRAQNDLTLSSESDPLYPSRTLLGLDYQVLPGVTLSLNQQFFSGGQLDYNSITSLDLNGTYQFGEDTTVTGRFSFVNLQELGGSIGIQQGWTIAPGLRATFSYEHIFNSIYSSTGAGARFPQPYAVGQSASALGVQDGDSYSVALAYTDNPDFQANARFEHRTASEGSNTVISASALGRITPAITALINFQQASSSNQTLEDLGTTTNLRFGLAYRDPDNDHFNALFRYEYRRNPATIPDTILFGSGTGSEDHVFSLEAIYAPDWRWEFYGKYALRHSTSYLADDLVGTSTVSLAQLRATYRLGYRWDISAEGRWISQPSADYSEMGLSIEAGYYLSPNLRLSAGYSFGSIDDQDFNGSRSSGGPFVGLTVKLDNNLLRDFGFDDTTPPQQQESIVQPVASDGSESDIPAMSTPPEVSTQL